MHSSANNTGSGHLFSQRMHRLCEYFIPSYLGIHENKEESRQVLGIEHWCIIENKSSSAFANI